MWKKTSVLGSKYCSLQGCKLSMSGKVDKETKPLFFLTLQLCSKIHFKNSLFIREDDMKKKGQKIVSWWKTKTFKMKMTSNHYYNQ